MRELLVALLIDILWGDPPNRYHPVAWMGRYIALAKGRTQGDRAALLAQGAGILFSGMALSALAGRGIERVAARLPEPLGVLLRALILKSTFSWRGLQQAAGEVQAALQGSDLPEARRLLAWHLVSRDTSELSPSQVAAAAIESVAENTSDGIVAPLFYYAVGGLPAALAYRFANTADAMLGYRDEEHEWLGKVPARGDDMLNFLPARLTAVGIVVAAWIMGEDGRGAWRVWRRDAQRTASPNAGHPMSAMAGALGVELTKAGHYLLGRGGLPPRGEDIGRALRLVPVVIWIVLGIVLPISHRFIGAGRRNLDLQRYAER